MVCQYRINSKHWETLRQTLANSGDQNEKVASYHGIVFYSFIRFKTRQQIIELTCLIYTPIRKTCILGDISI